MSYNYGAGHLPKKVIINPQDIEAAFTEYICGACIATKEECQGQKFRYTIGQGSKLSSGCLTYVRDKNITNERTVYAAESNTADKL